MYLATIVEIDRVAFVGVVVLVLRVHDHVMYDVRF